MRRAYVGAVQNDNGSLVRVGHIPRQRVNGSESAVPTVNVPFQPGKFLITCKPFTEKTVRVENKEGIETRMNLPIAVRTCSCFQFWRKFILEVETMVRKPHAHSHHETSAHGSD